MSILASVTEYMRHRAAHWRRRRTEHFINNLPLEIQKDIGWRVSTTPTRSARSTAHPALDPARQQH